MPKMTAGTIAVVDIMVIIGPLISIITSANTGKKAIMGIQGRNTTKNTAVISTPVTINTDFRTVRSPAVEVITVPIVSMPGAGVTSEGTIPLEVHTAVAVDCVLERIRQSYVPGMGSLGRCLCKLE